MKFSIYRTVLLLAPLVLALPFAMDIYVPAIPSIAHLFHISASTMQLTLTLFMLTAGIMQLFIGPISDTYGRRKITLLMIAIFSIGSILCALAHTITMLIIFRAIQAIGACGMLVLAFAIVRDMYHGIESAKAYSFLNGIIAFSPMFAPFIGSYIDVYFGWQETFLALLVISFFSFLTVGFAIPETLAISQRKKFDRNILFTYKIIFLNKIFSIYTLLSAFGLFYFYMFCSISPYIIIRQLHIPELNYGYYFCFMGISLFAGSFLSAFIVGKLGVYKTVFLGCIVTFIGGLLMLGWYLITGLTINNFIWPMLLIGIGGTFCLGAGSGGAMEPFGENTGAAAALSGGFRFAFSAIAGSILITKHLASTKPLAIPAIVFSLLGIIIFSTMRNLLDFEKNYFKKSAPRGTVVNSE